jgi:uncharacterized OsmC-like protein
MDRAVTTISPIEKLVSGAAACAAKDIAQRLAHAHRRAKENMVIIKILI